MFWPAVAQSHTKFFIFVERVRGIRNTSSMGTTKKSLAQTHPALAKEADGWDPKLVTAGSGRKLKWKCRKGHTWSAQVGSRALGGVGCPYCSGSKPIIGETDLRSTHPQIASEAKDWDPTTVSAHSNKKMLWECKSGHVWESIVAGRTRGSGCPVCSGQKVLPGFNDLKTMHPEIASQALDWDPTQYFPQSNKKLRWKCHLGHIWEAVISTRTRGNGCPVCGNQQLLPGFNDLATINPDLAKEADGWDPSTVFPGTSLKLNWKCHLGHKWTAIGYSRNKGNGCPTCAGKIVLVGFNDLASINPELAKEADGWDPSRFTISNGTKMSWKCALGHKWRTSISHRSNGTKCPTCAGQQVQSGFNDLSTLRPDLAIEAYEWDPRTVTVSSDRIEKWKCSKGHIYKAAVKGRNRGDGCAVCSGKQINVGSNDLLTTHPHIAKEAYGWDPTTVTAGRSSKKHKWKCPAGHIYEATPGARTREDKTSGCGICNGKIVLIGYNDLYSTHPELALQANGWDPKTVTAGSGKIKSWKCSEGHTWNAQVNSRQLSGCPTCHIGGYDPNKDGYLYFLSHPFWEMLQIGITNDPESRLATHKRLGWEVLELRGPMDGHLTQQWETAILRMLRSKGADLSNAQIAGKFDGFSEAWSKPTFEVGSIKELMQFTEKFESE
jgi:hypothetical protein